MTKPETNTNIGGMQWSVIFAGAFVAFALSIVLMQFGSIIGLSMDSPLMGEGYIASWGIIATGIWLLWIQLLASLSGGYIAGSMRTATPQYKNHENEMRDGIYGLTSWAVSTVGVFVAVSLMAAGAAYIEVHTEAENMNMVLSDEEQNTAIIFAFVAGATSLLSGVAAWWAAVMGGEHRDKKTNFGTSFSFKS
jgi:hypothetical protein